jgi:hypothetical protein
MVKNLEKIRSRLLYPEDNSGMKNVVMRVIGIRESTSTVGRMNDDNVLYSTEEPSIDVDIRIHFETNYEIVTSSPCGLLTGDTDDYGNNTYRLDRTIIIIDKVRWWLKYFGFDVSVVNIGEVQVCSCKSIV